MKKIIIIINGMGGAGKDTLCDIISKHYKTINISSITPIKAIAKEHGWNGEKDGKSRKFLSELKQAFTNYNNLPNQYLLSEYEQFKSDDNQIMFVQIREKEQIEKFIQSINIQNTTLLIRRNHNQNNQINQYILGNHSDDLVEDYNYKYYYNNCKPLDEIDNDFISFFNELLINEGIINS